MKSGLLWRRHYRAVLPCVMIVIAFVFLCSRSGFAQPIKGRNSLAAVQSRHREHFQQFSDELQDVIDFCRDKGLVEAAATVTSRIVPFDTIALKLPSLPRDVQPDIPLQLGADERFWRTQLRHHEKDYAKDLYLLSRQSLHAGHPSYAYRLIREAAFHDPDHPQIRKILGFVQSEGEWVTLFAAEQVRKGNVWHEEFGWLPKNHLARFASGERNFKGRWVTAEKERELRRDFNEAWQVRTDHYLIKTNYSQERAVALALALEDFYEFFNETFAGFFNSPEQLKKLFDGTARSVRSDLKPYVIHYYRSRDEYLNRLGKQFPGIEATNGVYLMNDRVIHFYHDENGDSEATLFHEATHQLFFESHNQPRAIAEHAHFWIIEGIACYMESFERSEGVMTIGDPGYIRFAGARANLLAEDGYFVPLRQFSSMGMNEFQSVAKPLLAKNYTQASGLARFLMHYDDGRYREALVQHLTDLYSGNARTRESAPGLDDLTGVDYEELDRQYRDDAWRLEQSELTSRSGK